MIGQRGRQGKKRWRQYKVLAAITTMCTQYIPKELGAITTTHVQI
jgi:hypothetical protein